MKMKSLSIGFLFFFIAFLFWIALTLNSDYITEIYLPIRLTNISKDIAIDEELPSRIKLKIKASGWNIIRTKYSNEGGLNLNINEYPNNSSVNLKEFVAVDFNLASGVQIMDVFPGSVKLPRKRSIEKQLVVIPRLNLTFKEGYDIVSQVKTKPEKITVRGTFNMLSKIDTIYTKEITMNNLAEDVKLSVPLDDTLVNTIFYDRKNIEVSFKVEQIVDKTIPFIKVITENQPINKHILMSPTELTVTLRGGIKTLSSLNQNNIKAIINFEKISLDSTENIKPQLNLPYGINLTKTDPENIKIEIGL